ncbi:MAG: carboxypeptidase-like regulatory domain-containing protein, partial [Pyrinomonadaceae bacterium]
MKRFALSALTLILFVASTVAQSNTGRLVGTVSDPTGVIPGATILITDNQTGRERTVVASDDGTFTVSQLEVGTYTVKISAPGHSTFTAEDVKIDVGRDYSLNATLQVGEITENVVVTAGADVINATTGELTNTVSPRQILELPLNGRNPLNLIALQAGTTSNGAQNTTINGQRSTFTNITRDGLNVQDNFIRGNAVDFVSERPSVDNTGEFTISTQNAGADRGYGSSQVQLVTPRGQNEFHGALFAYNRNSKFAANTFFRNRSGIERPFLNRNQFGGKLSGPIVPNKVFFFGSYEGLRLRTSSSQTRTILLPNARNGIFTYVDNAGVTRTVNLFSTFGTATGITAVNPAIQSRFLGVIPTAGNRTDIGDQLNT